MAMEEKTQSRSSTNLAAHKGSFIVSPSSLAGGEAATPTSLAPGQRHYVRVLMSEDNGGGYVSLRCDINTTALTLRTKALDKVEKWRVNKNLSGNLLFSATDFAIARRPASDAGSALGAAAVASEMLPLEARIIDMFSVNGSGAPIVQADGSKLLELHLVNATALAAATRAQVRDGEEPAAETQIHGFKNVVQEKYLWSEGTGKCGSSDSNPPATTWNVSHSASGRLYIRDFKSMYLTASPEGQVYCIAQAGEWSEWTIEDNDYLLSAHSTYLTAHAADGKLYCDGGKGAWGKWLTMSNIVEGTLEKKSSRRKVGKWQKRYFRLIDRKLCYWEKEAHAVSKHPPKGIVPCSDMQSVKLSPVSGLRLEVTYGLKVMHLKAEKSEECGRWITALRQEIKRATAVPVKKATTPGASPISPRRSAPPTTLSRSLAAAAGGSPASTNGGELKGTISPARPTTPAASGTLSPAASPSSVTSPTAVASPSSGGGDGALLPGSTPSHVVPPRDPGFRIGRASISARVPMSGDVVALIAQLNDERKKVNRLEGQVMRQLELIEKMKLDQEIRHSEERERDRLLEERREKERGTEAATTDLNALRSMIREMRERADGFEKKWREEKKEVDVQREIVKRLLSELQHMKEGRRVEGLLDEDERSTSSVAVLLTRLQLKEAECERQAYEAKEKDRVTAEQSAQLAMRTTTIADLQAEVARLLAAAAPPLPKKQSASGSSLLSKPGKLSSTASAATGKKAPSKTGGVKTPSVKKGSSSNKGTSSTRGSTGGAKNTASPRVPSVKKMGSETKRSSQSDDGDELLDSNSLQDELAAARRRAESSGFGLLSSVPSSPRSPTSSATGSSSIVERLAASESREVELREELNRVKTLAKSKVNDDEAEISRLNGALDDWKSKYATFVMEADARSKLPAGSSLTQANQAAIQSAVQSLAGLSVNSGTSRELRDAKDEAARLLAEHGTLMKELLVIKRQRDDLSRDGDELARKCALQTEQLLSLREEIARQAGAASSAAAAAAATPSDAAIARAREEAKQWESAFDSLKAEHARLKDAYDKISAAHAALDRSHQSLKNEHNTTLDGRSGVDRERSLATADAARADSEAKRLRAAVDALQHRTEGGQRDVESLTRDLEEQKNKVSAHERRLAKQEVERVRLQTMADQAQSDLNKAMTMTEQARNQVGEKEKELDRLRHELDALRKGGPASSRSTISSSSSAPVDDHDRKAERERDRVSIRTELESEINGTRDELARARLEVEKRIAEVQAVEKSCADRERELDKECEVLNQKIHEYNKRANDLNKRNDDLKRKKAVWKEQVKAMAAAGAAVPLASPMGGSDEQHLFPPPSSLEDPSQAVAQ